MINTDAINKKAREILTSDQTSFDGIGYLIWEKIPSELLFEESVKEVLDSKIDRATTEEALIIHAFRDHVHEHIQALKNRGIKRVRTGISWAEWETPGGREAIEWYIQEYFKSDISILPNLTYTPPQLGIEPEINSPPRNPMKYAVFVHDVCRTIGAHFDTVELWNEWDLFTDWNNHLDEDYTLFTHMITAGALVAQHYGKQVVLGGMSNLEERTQNLLASFHQKGLTHFLDVIGFHNIRGTWTDTKPFPQISDQIQLWQNIASKEKGLPAIKELKEDIQKMIPDAGDITGDILDVELAKQRESEPLRYWLTEIGFPPTDPGVDYEDEYLEEIQVALFAYAATLIGSKDLERCYWFTYKDLVSPTVRYITTGTEDILQFYFGDTKENGAPKLLARLLQEEGVPRVIEYVVEKNLWHLVDRASLPRRIPTDQREHWVESNESSG